MVLTQGYVAFISPEDVALLKGRNWTARVYNKNTVYAFRTDKSYGSTHTWLHHVVAGKKQDHVNRNGLDNRRSNLRPATKSQNMANAISRGGSSRFKGVLWDKARGKWKAQGKVNYKGICIGRFDLEEDAARAYDAWAIKAFGEFARLNFSICC